MTPEESLDLVDDRDSFIRFVKALGEQREQAERLEREEPERYCLGGALGWQNAEISAFLESALTGYFTSGQYHEPEQTPSWKMFAEFLYFGKIYE